MIADVNNTVGRDLWHCFVFDSYALILNWECFDCANSLYLMHIYGLICLSCKLLLLVHMHVNILYLAYCLLTICRQNEGSGQQCCYYSNGTLIFGPLGGGSADRFAPTGYYEIMKHHLRDLLPYIYCCTGQFSRCGSYYDLRPSDSGNDYEVTPPGKLISWLRIKVCRYL